MLIRKKEYRKYTGGGTTPIPYGQIGNFLGESADVLTPTNQYGVKSNFNAGLGAGLKGAGQGAAMGATIGSIVPGIGTVIGGVVGGAAGLIAGAASGISKNKKAQEEQLQSESLYSQMMNKQYLNKLQGYDTTGSNQNQIYAKLGGYVPISQSMSIGGDLNKLAENRYEVDGQSHEQGGVKFPNIGAELEGDETVSGDYVFSKVLGYADKHKPIARMMGKMEKKPSNPITKQTIEFLKGKEERLKAEQEETKAAIEGSIGQIMRYGGRIR